tara:strand:- start:12116 stop:12295 length:180 start_codon:yes stop_codon:yes gene_type:complete
VIKGKIKNEDSEYTYELNVTEEELIECYAREWVLNWCAFKYPEAFTEARKFIKKSLNEN